jgi:hypothetical protein
MPELSDEKHAPTVLSKATDSDQVHEIHHGHINLDRELVSSLNIDPVLTKKIALVNGAIDEIGMTPFQWKLFFLNGFGYGADTV